MPSYLRRFLLKFERSKERIQNESWFEQMSRLQSVIAEPGIDAYAIEKDMYAIDHSRYWKSFGMEVWKASRLDRIALLSKWLLLQSKSQFVSATDKEREQIMVRNSNRKPWASPIAKKREQSIRWMAEARKKRKSQLRTLLTKDSKKKANQKSN